MDVSISQAWWFSLAHFMEQGGIILWWLAGVVALSWLLVIERLIYLFCYFPKQQRYWLGLWKLRREHTSWYAKAIREGWCSEAKIALDQHLNVIKVLVAICPMLGLLGTVTGMIAVFDLMAAQGSSEPRVMASGISLATLPTMAGMVAALAGMFMHARLAKACRYRHLQLEKLLRSPQ